MNTAAFAQCMHRHRESRGLSMEQLAKQTGIDEQRLAWLETGMEKPRASELISIAGALDVPPLVLMHGGGTVHFLARDEEGKPIGEWKNY